MITLAGLAAFALDANAAIVINNPPSLYIMQEGNPDHPALAESVTVSLCSGEALLYPLDEPALLVDGFWLEDLPGEAICALNVHLQVSTVHMTPDSPDSAQPLVAIHDGAVLFTGSL